MSDINQHIIKHTRVEMNFNRMDFGPEQQSEMRVWLDRLMTEMEKEFDSLAPEDVFMCIENLSVELDIADRSWKEESIRTIVHEITDQVQLQSRGVATGDGYKKQSPAAHFRDVFMSFLQFGYLPWYAKNMDSKRWHETKEKLFDQDEPLLSEALWDGIQKDANFRKRLQTEVTWQLFMAFIVRHVKYLGEEEQKLVEDTRLFEKSMVQMDGDTFAYQVFFAAASKDSGLLKKTFHSNNSEPSPDRKMLEQINGVAFKSKGFKQIQDWGAGNANDENIEKEAHLLKSTRLDLSVKDGIYISNAGLVIIAAFLPSFFTKLGFWKDGEWVKRQDAVAALEFLASASSSFEEYQLVLPKLLCGMGPEEFVETKSFNPNKEISTESEALLASVIEHWSILKATSIEGLQSTFLQRDGKLIETDDAWMLWVEQKPFDMLLRHLPWNISMLKLPWMGKMLRTEWIY